MEHVLNNNLISNSISNSQGQSGQAYNLTQAQIDTEYTIKDVLSHDEELKNFLFTLGCYEGEQITVISRLSENYVIAVKDARYSIDEELAEAIII